MKFRQDINALRAIAVVSVVLFHFNHDWLPGGFAGVDVFFVISGFLMTMIIVKDLEKGSFSILSFYKARVRRIIPALAVLCFTLMFLGLLLLSPIDYMNLGKHTAASLSFLSNIVYWGESNYFNPSSNEKWLLHTWSLSVEWQFYLIYPIFLAILKKLLTLKQLKITIVVSTLLALLLSILVTMKSSSAAYFLLPTRAWQMLAGGLVFLYPLSIKTSAKKWIQFVGLLLIVTSFFLFTSATPWPGYASLVPIIGSCLVLISNNNDSIIVNNRVTDALGKWSYSIYLWHWPIVVANYYFKFSNNWWILGIPLAVLLGAMSFKLIESKSLADYKLNRLEFILKPLPFALTVIVLGFVVFKTDGLVSRYSKEYQIFVKSALEAKDDWYYPEPNLKIGTLEIRYIEGRSDKNILLMGASHIEQLYPYADSLVSEYNIYFLTQSGCFITPSMKNPKWDCSNLQDYIGIFDSIKFEKVVTSFYSFPSYLPKDEDKRKQAIARRVEEYDKYLTDIKSLSEDIYLILGEPRGDEFDPIKSIRGNLPNSITELTARAEYQEHQYALNLLKELDGVHLIDPISYLCVSGQCLTRNNKLGFFYRDENHMRPAYAIENLNYLDSIFLSNR